MTRRRLDGEISALLAQPSRRAIAVRRPRERLEFRSIGREGEPWPAWLRSHKGSCGVYVIAEHGRPVYVGSSRSRLYDTITRHFQAWHRRKTWWKGLYGAGHDPGMTYERGRCTVAIVIVPCGAELEAEAAWIERLRPRDNLTQHPDGGEEPVPF